MYIITILALLLLAQIIAYRVDKKLADTLPMTVCGFILVLYVLSVFRVLSWIDYISIPILLLCIIWIMTNGIEKDIFSSMFSIQNVSIYIFFSIILLSQISRIATNWEDLSFASTDLKALWFNDGLAEKYTNVAPEYGDYPPAFQLFRWFFVHTNPNRFVEGLGYAGYMCLNYILLLPLISNLDFVLDIREKIYAPKDEEVDVRVSRNNKYYVSNKKLVSKYKVRIAGNSSEVLGERLLVGQCIKLIGINLLAGVCLLLFPTICGTFCADFCCMDVTAGVLYGFLLWSIYDRENEGMCFYFARIALAGSVLVISRPSGIGWCLLAILFWGMLNKNENKGNRYNKSALYENKVKYGLYTIALHVLIWFSWIVVCLINRRISGWTSVGYDIASSEEKNLLYYTSVKILAFFKGLLFYPTYDGDRLHIDIPTGILIVSIFVVIILLLRKDILTGNKARLLMLFSAISAAITFFCILVANITIFTSDIRYSSESFIISSAARYGAPWILGTIYLLIAIFIQQKVPREDMVAATDWQVRDQISSNWFRSIRTAYMTVAIAVLLTSDVASCYRSMIGYRTSLQRDLQSRVERLDEEERKFIDIVKNAPELKNQRILYLKDAGNVRIDDNAFISYELSPVSVVYGAITYETSKEDVDDIIARSHADIIYVEDIEEVDVTLKKVLEWQHTSDQGEARLYRVLDSGRIEPYRTTIEIEH